MRLIKKGGQALSFFVLVLRHSSMDSFGVRSLGSAAAQGGHRHVGSSWLLQLWSSHGDDIAILHNMYVYMYICTGPYCSFSSNVVTRLDHSTLIRSDRCVVKNKARAHGRSIIH